MDMNSKKNRNYESWKAIGEKPNYANYPANRLTLRLDNQVSDG
jgi:hypothetical protein